MASSESTDENSDYELLITRASKYNRETEATALADVGNVKPTRVTVRGKNFFLCEEHGKKTARIVIGNGYRRMLTAHHASCMKRETLYLMDYYQQGKRFWNT